MSDWPSWLEIDAFLATGGQAIYVWGAYGAAAAALACEAWLAMRRGRRARRAASALAALLIAASSPPACGREAVSSAADPVLEAHLRNLARELRCLACGNETLADSHAPLADDLRAQMRAMLRAGASDDEVRRFLTARYGDVVTHRPPLRAATIGLWGAAAALLAAALLRLRPMLRRRARPAADHLEPRPEHAAHESFT